MYALFVSLHLQIRRDLKITWNSKGSINSLLEPQHFALNPFPPDIYITQNIYKCYLTILAQIYNDIFVSAM